MELSDLAAKWLLLENVPRVLEALDRLLKNISVPANLIGGVALGYYNYIRNTEDIDVLIKQLDYEKVVTALLSEGAHWLGKENKYDWQNHTIQVCYGGLRIRDTTLPDPTNTVPGLIVIDLPRLLAMKIEGGMHQHRHRTDFIELVKRNSLGVEYVRTRVLPLLQPQQQRLAMVLFEKGLKEL
jgi:hypothetical protein